MLNIYRASAGSGKTFQLTSQYLELLFENKKFPHRNILAVTFTNKATEEMKSRILQELDCLAYNKKSAHLESLIQKYGLTETEIRTKAKQILINILHDYGRFSISTIDHFFLQVIRAFTRDIGLQGGYNIELDSKKVLSESIEQMMFDLSKEKDQELLNWLIQFSEKKMEEGENWDIRNDIKKLGEEIFKENDKSVFEKAQDKKFLKNYIKTLKNRKEEIEKNIQEAAEEGLKIINKNNLETSDFIRKLNSPFNVLHSLKNNIVKELSDSFLKLPNNIDNWYTKTSDKKEEIKNAYNNGLNDCINKIVEYYENNYEEYLSIKSIYSNLYSLGILSDIDKQIKLYLEEKNLMLLSNGNDLLNKIIDGSDTPFIYEKVGVNIHHYMIDEFQDTSGLQWSNFLPLIKNSLSQNNNSLIVGDVKQSIYRWRNSDWKLLEHQLEKDFHPEEIHQEVLDTNWRSKKNIVDFNNAFFSVAAKELDATLEQEHAEKGTTTNDHVKITAAYKKLYQKTSPKEGAGHVKIEFVSGEKKNKADFQNLILEKLPQTVENLQEKGFELKDIAILVREKKEGVKIANYLLDYKKQHPNSAYKYDVISDEALLIENANTIKFIIYLLKQFSNPENELNESKLAFEYLCYIKNNPASEALKKYFENKKIRKTAFIETFGNNIVEQLNKIKHLSLFEMVEEMIQIFKLGENKHDCVFLQAFQDCIFEYISKNNSDVNSFLNWWETIKEKKSISTPNGQNAIRILTIHKSKGLDFEAVIIPFCDWEFSPKNLSLIWCKPTISPYNELKTIPTTYSSALKKTMFYTDYIYEKTHAYIDNLNVAYVAFTRAKSELIAFCKKNEKTESVTLSNLLYNCIQNKEKYSYQTIEKDHDIIPLHEYFKTENLIFEIGTHEAIVHKKEQKEVNEIKMETYISEKTKNQIRIKLNSENYFGESQSKINYGKIMHELLNNITTNKDIDQAILKLTLSGMLLESETRTIKEKVINFIEKPEVKDWFSGKYRVINEASIITPKGETYRPDRILFDNTQAIVIDYKFGEKEERKYHSQVKNYMKLIQQMGYQCVGYICYVELDIFEKVL